MGLNGAGLGLAIVKKLIEAHNGKIEVENNLAKGSTFHVLLPLVNLCYKIGNNYEENPFSRR